jgi:superkiller protein 3
MQRVALWPLVGLLASMAATQPLGPEQARLARERYQRGLSLMTAESWDEAVEEFQAAIELDPYLAVAYYNLGQCRMAQKRYVEAVAAYTGCRHTIERLGSLSMKERGERERARVDEINELKNALQVLPTLKQVNVMQETTRIEDRLRFLESMQFREGKPLKMPAEVPLALGSAYFRQGKLEDAEREYLEAVELNDRLGAAHNNLAVIYLMTGQLEEAESAIRRAEKSGFRVNPNLKKDLKEAKAAATAKP